MQWMKAGDVVRAMKDMLKTCEGQKRGDLKVHKDGIHFADERGQPAGPREPASFATVVAVTLPTAQVL